MQQRVSGSADSDSIAFEISDIDPKALLKGGARPAAPAEAKRPDLRVVQTDRLPRLEINPKAADIPQLISDDSERDSRAPYPCGRRPAALTGRACRCLSGR